MKLMNLLERLVVTQERIADAFEEQTRTNTERSAWLTNIEDNELDRRRDEVIAAQQGATDALLLSYRPAPGPQIRSANVSSFACLSQRLDKARGYEPWTEQVVACIPATTRLIREVSLCQLLTE